MTIKLKLSKNTKDRLSFIGDICLCDSLEQILDLLETEYIEAHMTFENVPDLDYGDDEYVDWNDFSKSVLKSLSKMNLRNRNGKKFSDFIEEFDW